MRISTRGSKATRHSSWKKGKFEITTDPSRIDLSLVHHFLTNCYWAKGIPAKTVRRSIQHSLCFGIYQGAQQAGFARVITDRATFAYIGDVFVIEEHRGRGIEAKIMEVIVAHPDLQSLRR